MEYIASTRVKLRKDRKCWACLDLKLKGEFLTRVVSKDNEIMTAYFCDCCEAFIQQSNDFKDGIEQGEFRGEEVYKNFKAEFIFKQ